MPVMAIDSRSEGALIVGSTDKHKPISSSCSISTSAPKNNALSKVTFTPNKAVPDSEKLNPVTENLKFCTGLAILIAFGPFVAWQIFWCTTWEYVDKHTINLVQRIAQLSEKVTPTLARFTRHPKDGFVVLFLVYLGCLIPGIFFYELHQAVNGSGFSYRRAVAYNLLRIGPMYENFKWCYTLCHKEGHSASGGLFRRGAWGAAFGSIFNLWAGMFHGVIPGVFTISHLHNHHKYDNDENDVYSTAFRPRDRFSSWVCYVAEWMAYATNLSSFLSFVKHKEWKRAVGTVLSTAYYLTFVATIAYMHGTLCFWYLFYPLMEGNILLSAVNFAWHAFIDPDDPSNDYVNSTTVVNGLNFCLQEEYHVVHHQYAGVHWSKHQELYEKNLPQYKKAMATIFCDENIFVIFGCIVAKDYDKLADLYFEKPAHMSKAALAQLLKTRLQCSGPSIAKRIGRSAKSREETDRYFAKEVTDSKK